MTVTDQLAAALVCLVWIRAQYRAAGISQLRLPTTDGVAPRHASLDKAVEWVSKVVADGKQENKPVRVFVHCR